MNTKVVGITFASTMLFATITSGLLLSSSSTHAADDSAVTVTEITVPSSCSMTANVSTPHIADIVNGNRAINIGKTTLSTFCNDPGGFAIYAIGYTNNELGATNVIATNNTDTIATGNTAPSNNSSWGMKVVNSSSSQFPATITPYFNVATNDGYVAVPNTFTLMASRNSGTAMDSATLLDTTYGAYISPTQPVGEYNGQVLYTMVHPSSAAGPNAGTMFEAAFLMQPTPPAKKTVGSNSYYKMQDMTPDICTVMSIGAEGQMVDDRDNKIYWVLKAKDGKCWMTQNLDHDIVTTTNFYTPANTNVTSNWTASAATIKSMDSNGNFVGWNDSNSAPVSGDPGDWYFTDTYYTGAACKYTTPGSSCESFSQTPYPGNGMHGHVGNYYNWTATIASNDSSAYTVSTYDNPSASPKTSICPAGWRLPVISSVFASNEYTKLVNLYHNPSWAGDEAAMSAPLYFTRNGYVNTGVFSDNGTFGVYYSSTFQSNAKTFYMYLRKTGFGNTYGADRFTGATIRCVAADTERTIQNITYMQDITSEIINNTPIGTTATLKDNRDETSYTVSKMADGKIWMLDNLALDITDSTILSKMNASNTNATATTLGYLRGDTTRNPSTDPNGNYAIAGVINWTSGFSYGAPLASLTDKDVVPTGTDPMAQEAVQGNWKNGGFYNYCAASAGSFCFGSDRDTPGNPSGNASEDICPNGWRLPTGGTGGEYSALTNAVVGESGTFTGEKYTTFRRAFHLPLPGFYDERNINSGGSGYVQSSTKNEPRFMHTISMEQTTMYPLAYQSRLTGFSVRCIAK